MYHAAEKACRENRKRIGNLYWTWVKAYDTMYYVN